MKYTIKQLADLSGVSTRTLLFYDSIKLLSPAGVADNGYRFYGEKELLLLQQILFFRELGFQLKEIKLIVQSDDFNQLEALKKHKTNLSEKINTFKSLIKTIDNTTAHLGGKIEMQEKDLYMSFKDPVQIEMLKILEGYIGPRAKEIIQQFIDNNPQQKITDEQTKEQKQQAEKWCALIKSAIEKGLKPSAKTVQAIIDEHYQTRVKPFSDMTPVEFAKMYQAEAEHSKMKKRFDAVHPKMAAYMLEAVNHYLKKDNTD